MNHPTPNQSASPNASWAAAVVELCTLEGAGGMEWARLEPYITAAEPVVLLRIEREEALRSGRPFTKCNELQRAEEALLMIKACGVMIGARIMERMAKLAGSTEDEPKSRFSDAAIEWVFSRLHWWEIDPNDEEMQDAVRRYFWLGRHGGRATR